MVNVALNKPANSSSWTEGGNPEHGNDGNSDNRHRKQFCVETNREDYPWWKVDLLTNYEVYGVLITSNADAGINIRRIFGPVSQSVCFPQLPLQSIIFCVPYILSDRNSNCCDFAKEKHNFFSPDSAGVCVFLVN